MLIAIAVLIDHEKMSVLGYHIDVGLRPDDIARKALEAWQARGILPPPEDASVPANKYGLFVHVWGEMPQSRVVVPKVVIPTVS